jgi:hypothetical protein
MEISDPRGMKWETVMPAVHLDFLRPMEFSVIPRKKGVLGCWRFHLIFIPMEISCDPR